MPENITAWRLWNIINGRDRPVGFSGALPLPTRAAEDVCNLYEEGMETFEKIMLVENTIFPKLQERAKEEREKKQKNAPKKQPKKR